MSAKPKKDIIVAVNEVELHVLSFKQAVFGLSGICTGFIFAEIGETGRVIRELLFEGYGAAYLYAKGRRHLFTGWPQ